MEKIKILQKFKGELNGSYQTLWVATSENGNYFMAPDLPLKQVGNNVVNDVGSTKWTFISNEYNQKINDEMICVAEKHIISKDEQLMSLEDKTLNKTRSPENSIGM